MQNNAATGQLSHIERDYHPADIILEPREEGP
jgi:hypothetical protein